MKYIIETADNGYILTTPPESEEDRGEVQVFEEYESEKKSFEALVYQLAEDFGFTYDKWKKDNLKISWNKKGHKYEDNIQPEKQPVGE